MKMRGHGVDGVATSSGRSPGCWWRSPRSAPPPLSMCLMPFAHALAELGHAVRRVRFNKEGRGAAAAARS